MGTVDRGAASVKRQRRHVSSHSGWSPAVALGPVVEGVGVVVWATPQGWAVGVPGVAGAGSAAAIGAMPIRPATASAPIAAAIVDLFIIFTFLLVWEIAAR
jgi:hypothetical protein